MDGYQIFCDLAFGTSLDPNKTKRRKNKLKNYKRNKRRRLEEAQNEPTEVEIKKDNSDDDDESDSDKETQKSQEIKKKQKKKRPKNKKFSKLKLLQIQKAKVVHFRRTHRIYVTGNDIPDPIETFEQLSTDYNVQPVILENIKNSGYSIPTPIQMQALPLLMNDRQILACAPTGSGKTAAFLIPIIHNLKEHNKGGIRSIIIAPTRELSKQILNFCIKLSEGTGLKPFIIENVKNALEKPKIFKKHDILITTPNRLIYLLKNDPPILNLNRVEWLIVDECDKLFEIGTQGFREQLAVIFKACDAANLKRALFSATFSHSVEDWCKLTFDSLATVSIGSKNMAVETVKQELLFVGCEGGKLLALRELLKKGFIPPVMIFVQSKERAQELYTELVYENYKIGVIHADLAQTERENVVKNFISGKIWVLICTDLMARGIDFKGVNLVINYDFPPTAIAYIHRIGRTGRAGESGQAITYFTTDDVENLRSIAQVIKNAGCEVPDYIMKLKKKRMRNKDIPVIPIKREKISTVPDYELEKEKKRQKYQNRKKKKFKKSEKT